MLAAKNLPKPITKPSEGSHWLGMLAAELTVRLSDAREKIPGLWPRTLGLHASQGWGFSRSKQRPFSPPRRQTDIGVDFLTTEASKLWKELSNSIWCERKDIKITHLSLSFTGIQWNEEGQRGIQSFFHTKAPIGGGRSVSEGVAGPSNLGSVASLSRKRSVSIAPCTTSENKITIDLDQGELFIDVRCFETDAMRG